MFVIITTGLFQLDKNLRYQMMTTIVWMEQEWTDYKLKWDPDDYGGITKVSGSRLGIRLVVAFVAGRPAHCLHTFSASS